MKWKFGKSYERFCFQVRESPAPLNIPTPTPAPDQGGPVACLSGPATCLFSSVLLICFGSCLPSNLTDSHNIFYDARLIHGADKLHYSVNSWHYRLPVIYGVPS